MNRKERTEQKMQELFHSHAAGNEGTDGAFMQNFAGLYHLGMCATPAASITECGSSSRSRC